MMEPVRDGRMRYAPYEGLDFVQGYNNRAGAFLMHNV